MRKAQTERHVEDKYYQSRPPFNLKFDSEGQYFVPDDDFPTALEILAESDVSRVYRTITENISVAIAIFTELICDVVSFVCKKEN